MTGPAMPSGPPHYRAYRVVLAVAVITAAALLLVCLLALAFGGPAVALGYSPGEWL